MRHISFKMAFVVALVGLLAACGGNNMSGKPGSSGKTLELMVVSPNSLYSGSTRAILDSLFATPQDGLNQPEPRFDVVQITPSSFDGNTMFQAHRNILILEVDAQGQNKVYRKQDQWSQPQVVIRITAQDRNTLDSLLLVNGNRLLSEYYAQEYRRMDKVFSQTPGVKIMQALQRQFGFTLSIPEEFALAKQTNDFMWIRKEAKDFSLQLYVKSDPAGDHSALDEAAILDRIDTMMHRYVPGPSEGSYPGVERRDFFYSREVTLGELNAVETRGLWRTYNDFMGGPFVAYSFVSPDGQQLITLVGCVYSPSQRNRMVMKRDLLMQLEGICRSVRFE